MSETRRRGELKLVKFTNSIKLKNIINSTGKRGLAYFQLTTRGATKVGQLSGVEWNRIKRFVGNQELKSTIEEAII